MCTVHYIVHLQCTFSLSYIHTKLRDSDVLAWILGQRKMGQLLGAFGLLDLPCYGPFSLGARFETYGPVVSLILRFFLLRSLFFFNFPNYFSGRGKPRILNQWVRGHDCIHVLYFHRRPHNDPLGPKHVAY
jgi:hypothetical protein